ncbi:MAG: hypothetical protein Q9181_003437 [Wetmoreana brouardii]
MLPKNDYRRPAGLYEFGSRIYEEFLFTGSEKKLDDAIRYLQEACDCIFNSNALLHRYQRKAYIENLNKAISIHEEVVGRTPMHDATRSQRLDNLALAYRLQYQRSGPESLSKALRLAYDALNGSATQPSERPPIHNNIANLYGDMYRKTGSMEALMNAIQHNANAIREGFWFPQNQEGMLGYFNSIQAHLRQRFRRLANIKDLDCAIYYAKTAAEETKNDYCHGIYYSNLGSLYYDKYLSDPGSVKHLDDAIVCKKRALKLASKDHPERSEWYNGLANIYHLWFRNSKLPPHLEEAIGYAHEALESTYAGDLRLGNRLNSLGVVLNERSQLNGSRDEADKAVNYFQRALREKNSPPLERIKAGKRGAEVEIRFQEWERAAVLLAEAIDLIGRLVLRSNSSDDHQHNLKQLTSLGPLAASVFINARKRDIEALQVLEKARGVISSLVMDSRTDITELQEQHPDISSRYQHLREAVAASESSSIISNFGAAPNNAGEFAPTVLQHECNVDQLGIVEDQIRQLPGFERFQEAPTEKDMCALAQQGPLVSYNITQHGSHAFLITGKSIRVLGLPNMSIALAEEYISSMPTGNDDRSLRRDFKVISVNGISQPKTEKPSKSPVEALRLLWTNAVKPVLKDLNLLRTDHADSKLPFVWWVGGGLMSLLPLHAAGDHHTSPSDSTMSYAISSYTPTLKALQYLRRKGSNYPTSSAHKILVVAMPRTLDEIDLQVDQEIRSIQDAATPATPVEVLLCPSKDEVLEQITTASVVHFACHGSSDRFDPSDSALVLGGEKRDILRVKELWPLDHRLATIAYLSACSTAETRYRRLIDESIHLVSAFQLVGFRHVMGTLWGATDSAAAAVAADFYTNLFQEMDTPSAVAKALHLAVLKHKRSRMVVDVGTNANNLDWVPFVHYGP